VEQSRAWWHSRSRAFLSECARLVESRIGGDATEAVFLCGSFAGGDESVVLETDPPILLSDVDLVAVVKSFETLIEWSRRRAELGAACEDLWCDVRFSGRVDVGVMLAKDLTAMPARPGVYDMRALGKVLVGDPTILERIPAYAPSDITAREAVILIENRSVSLLDARFGRGLDGGAEPYGFLYRIARVYTDIAAAALSIAGAYAPGYAARAELIRAKVRAGGNDSLSRLIEPDLCDRIEQWTAFKLKPAIAAADADQGLRGLEKLWEEAANDLLAFWRRVVAGALDGRRESAGLSVDALAGRIGPSGSRRDNLRGWKAYLSRVSVSRRIALCAALRKRLLSRNPLDAVREESMRLLEHRVTLGAAVPVRGARGGFPYHGGSWDRAAEELCSAWNGLVFGRANG
jgi:predicted nucleotidyltransferase